VLTWISQEIPEAVKQNGDQFTYLILTGTPVIHVPTPYRPTETDTPEPLPSETQAPPTRMVRKSDRKGSLHRQPGATQPPAAQPTTKANQPARAPSIPCCGGVGFILAGMVIVQGARWRKAKA